MTAPLAELVEGLARSGKFEFVNAASAASLFTWADVDHVLIHSPDAWHRVDRRMRRQLSLAVNSTLVPSPRVLEDRGKWGGIRVSLSSVHDALHSGSTLMINDVHALFSTIGAVAQEATIRLNDRVTVRAFASKSATPGFRSHIDLTDTVVMQTAGRKLWTVWEPTRLRPVKDDVIRHPPPAGAPLWEGVLSEGDVLYVPAGWWHRPVGLGEPSLHLSIDIHRSLRWEVLRTGKAALRAAAPGPVFAPSSHGGLSDSAALAQWGDLLYAASLGRRGSFFDDPLDRMFASPLSLFRTGTDGGASEVSSNGRFSYADIIACLDQGGMVRIAHTERFLESVAERVNEIEADRGTLGTATLVGRDGRNGPALSGIAGTDRLLLQAEGSARWDVTTANKAMTDAVLEPPNGRLFIPSGARYHSPPTRSRSLHIEIDFEPPAEARERRLRHALNEASLARLPLPTNGPEHRAWLGQLHGTLMNRRGDTPA